MTRETEQRYRQTRGVKDARKVWFLEAPGPGTLWATTQCSWVQLSPKRSLSNPGGAPLWNSPVTSCKLPNRTTQPGKSHLLDLSSLLFLSYLVGPLTQSQEVRASLSLFFLPQVPPVSQFCSGLFTTTDSTPSPKLKCTLPALTTPPTLPCSGQW